MRRVTWLVGLAGCALGVLALGGAVNGCIELGHPPVLDGTGSDSGRSSNSSSGGPSGGGSSSSSGGMGDGGCVFSSAERR